MTPLRPWNVRTLSNKLKKAALIADDRLMICNHFKGRYFASNLRGFCLVAWTLLGTGCVKAASTGADANSQKKGGNPSTVAGSDYGVDTYITSILAGENQFKRIGGMAALQIPANTLRVDVQESYVIGTREIEPSTSLGEPLSAGIRISLWSDPEARTFASCGEAKTFRLLLAFSTDFMGRAIAYAPVDSAGQLGTAQIISGHVDNRGYGQSIASIEIECVTSFAVWLVHCDQGCVTHSEFSIRAGGSHSLFLTPDIWTDGDELLESRDLYGWGSNGSRQLGITEDRFLISQPEVLPQAQQSLQFTSIAAGGNNTCGITKLGQLYCWGRNNLGQLGSHAVDEQGQPLAESAEPIPITFPFGTFVTSVSTSGGVICALAFSSLYCWGDNSLGQLGIGRDEFPDSTADPQLVAGTWSRVVSGGSHTCAISTDRGQLYCWGFSSSGQIGNGSIQPADVPKLVTHPAGHPWIDIGLGQTHTCAIDVMNQAYCWGDNSLGQLGRGNTTGNSSVPVGVQQPANVKFWSVSAGAASTCMLDGQHKVHCWGANNQGQLGDGSTTDRSAPQLQPINLSYSAFSLGHSHACAVERDSFNVYCWGKNFSYQVGDGTSVNRPTPKMILSP